MEEDRARKVKRLFQTLSDDAAVAVDYIDDAVLQTLATNPKFPIKKGNGSEIDANLVDVPLVDSKGNVIRSAIKLRLTDRFVMKIKEERLTQLLKIALVKEEVANFYMVLYDFADVKISLREDGSVYVAFFMKKPTYSEEKEEQTMSIVSKYIYKLKPIPAVASEKAISSLYYSTKEEACEARAALWAKGEILPESVITRINIEPNPPKYRGVIIKAELQRLPLKHEPDEWWINNLSFIKPISCEDYAQLRYPDAQDEFQEQELMDADSPEDLKKWLPYISPEDNCGKRFFYVYIPDNVFDLSYFIPGKVMDLACFNPGKLVVMVSEAYDKFLKSYQRQVLGLPHIHIPGSEIPWNITPTDYNERQETAKDIRDEYPDILMVKFSYPDCIKSRRDFQDWDLLNVWQCSELVWSLDPKTLEDTVRYNRTASMIITLNDGVFADVRLSLLFNIEEALPLVVFGRYEVFLFVRYNKLKYEDNEKTHQFFVKRIFQQALENRTFKLRKIG